MFHHWRVRAVAGALVAASLTLATGASANAIKMPTLLKTVQERKANLANGTPLDPGVTPPAPPCPENGQLPSPFSNCGLPEFPATGAPLMGNMSYWGGKVQVHPKIYLVYWGWGQTDAFPNNDCSPETVTEGSLSFTLPCDPDGAGKYMADFVHQMGGTDWAGVSTQFFQNNADGTQSFVSNDKDLLAGVLLDDTVPANFEKTSGTNPPGDTNTYTLMAKEAERAAAQLGVTGDINANIVIVQPPGLSDPNALSQGYCAFHDYTQPKLFGGIYDGITPGIVYSNIPYQLAINSGGTNVCGKDAVNDSAHGGDLDGFSIVLGHEIEEAVTDPGAEDIQGGDGITTPQTKLGGWYDPLDANENGDKCAWVGIDPTDLQGTEPVPGAAGDIKGNDGGTFAVQSLWSNKAAGGAGYCAGAGTDLPF